MLLNFEVSNTDFVCTNTEVASTAVSIDYLKCHFETKDSIWRGVDAICAIFKSATYNITKEVMLDSNGDCYVDPEVYKRGGVIQVKLVGDKYVDDTTIVSTSHVTRIVEFRIRENIIIPTDTPSKYDVFVAELTKARRAVSDIITFVQNKLDNGDFDGEDGVGISSVNFNADGTVNVTLTDGAVFTSEYSFKGPKGDTGEPGNSIANISYSSDGRLTIVMSDGTQFVSEYSMKGEKGDRGETGATPVITIGTVETLVTGSQAYVTLTGDVDDPVLNFGIPEGPRGDVFYATPDVTTFAEVKAACDANKVVYCKEDGDDLLIPLINYESGDTVFTFMGPTTQSNFIMRRFDLIAAGVDPDHENEWWRASLVHFAPEDSPEFTGTPTAPTPTAGTSNQEIATTKFVDDAITSIPKNIFYGTCSSNAEAGVKVVTVNDPAFTRKVGTIVFVYFENDACGIYPMPSCQMNVNNTGAYFIFDRVKGSNRVFLNGLAWRAGQIVPFVYNGSGWVRADKDNIQPDWNATNTTSDAYIKHKPNIPTNTSDLENDVPYLSLEDLEALLPTDTASGDIASITDGQSVVPVKSLKVTLEPIQSGSGTPSPDNVRPISGRTEVVTHRTGINVWDEEWEVGGLTSNGQPTANNNNIRSNNFIPVTPQTQYYIKVPMANASTPFTVVVCGYDAEMNFVKRIKYSGGNAVFTTSDNSIRYIKFCTVSTSGVNYGNTYNNDISINYPSTDTEYHAYDGTTYTTALGQTVYGGTLDVVSGELVVDRAIAVFDGTENYDNRYFPTVVCTKTFETGKGIGSDFICNYCPPSTAYMNYASTAKNTFQFSNVSTNWGVNSADEMKAKVAQWYADGEPLTIAYPLATPQTIQLAPQEVQLLRGTNNIWSDGEVALTYNADIQKWVEKKLNGNSIDNTVTPASASPSSNS